MHPISKLADFYEKIGVDFSKAKSSKELDEEKMEKLREYVSAKKMSEEDARKFLEQTFSPIIDDILKALFANVGGVGQ